MRLAILLLAVCCLHGADGPGSIRTLLEQKKFSQALAEAQALNRQVPDNVEVYELLAAAHLAMGNLKEAERAAQWMLDLRLGKYSAGGARVIAAIRRAYGDRGGAIDILASAYRRIGNGEEHLRSVLLREWAELLREEGKHASAERVLAELNRLAAK